MLPAAVTVIFVPTFLLANDPELSVRATLAVSCARTPLRPDADKVATVVPS